MAIRAPDGANKNDNKRNAASYYKAKTMANGTRLLAPGLPGTHLVSLVSKKVQIMNLLLRTPVSVDKQRKIGLRQIMRKCDEKKQFIFCLFNIFFCKVILLMHANTMH